jgi:hypothetical protein
MEQRKAKKNLYFLSIKKSQLLIKPRKGRNVSAFLLTWKWRAVFLHFFLTNRHNTSIPLCPISSPSETNTNTRNRLGTNRRKRLESNEQNKTNEQRLETNERRWVWLWLGHRFRILGWLGLLSCYNLGFIV